VSLNFMLEIFVPLNSVLESTEDEHTFRGRGVSGDASPCRMTGVTLHGVVSPEGACLLPSRSDSSLGSSGTRKSSLQQLTRCQGLLADSQGHNLAVTVLHVPYSLDSGAAHTTPPWRQLRGKYMLSSVNSLPNSISRLWEIDLGFAPGSPTGWGCIRIQPRPGPTARTYFTCADGRRSVFLTPKLTNLYR